MDSPSNQDELFLRWQADGDREALGELLCQELAAIKRSLRKQGGVHGDCSASDVAQSALRRVIKKDAEAGLPSIASAGSLHSYLWRVAHNRLIDLLRKRREGTTLETIGRDPGDPRADTSLERVDADDALSTAIELLPCGKERRLALRIARGEMQRHLAEEMVASGDAPTLAAARMRIGRVREALAEKLAMLNREVLGD